jgi:hypothetical protein
MARDFQITGGVMVKVKVGAHVPLSGAFVGGRYVELGLSSDSIRITPVLRHRDVVPDDFGPDAPAEVMAQLAEVRIDMTLVHYDQEVLETCIAESTGGAMPDGVGGFLFGRLPPGGSLLGNYCQPLASGCHFVSLNLVPFDNDQQGWRFPTSYLADTPVMLPLGTKASMTDVSWRAVPYVVPAELTANTPNYSGEIISSGASLWSHTLDS